MFRQLCKVRRMIKSQVNQFFKLLPGLLLIGQVRLGQVSLGQVRLTQTNLTFKLLPGLLLIGHTSILLKSSSSRVRLRLNLDSIGTRLESKEFGSRTSAFSDWFSKNSFSAFVLKRNLFEVFSCQDVQRLYRIVIQLDHG